MSTRDPVLTKLLIEELGRHLRELRSQTRGDSKESTLEPTRRAVHALKGSAGLAGEPELASAMQRLERRLRDGDPSAFDEVISTITQAIERLEAGKSGFGGVWPEPPPDLAPGPIDPLVRAQYIAEIKDRLAQIDEALGSTNDAVSAATTVYRHVHTMKGAASAVSDEPMAWFCHGLEERIRGGGASSEAAVTSLEVVARYRGVLGGLLDDPDAALATLRGVPMRPRTTHRPSQRPQSAWPDDEHRGPEGDATVRVSAQAVDHLLDHVGGITVARERVAARVSRTSEQAQELRRVRAELAEALRLIGPPRPWGAPAAALRRIDNAAQILAEMGDDFELAIEELEIADQALKDNTGSAKKLLSAMRQTPIRGMFARLSAAVLAESRRMGRLVSIRTSGADEPIDRRLAEQLAEPCLQIARNAIAHGMETPEAREARGLPREVTLTFAARRQANRLLVTIGDDGAGVDVAAVRARAVEAGVVTEVLAEAADDQTLLELLFLPGFSMRAQSPDLLAGRGIGLDITLAAVQKLGGTIRLSSRLGGGFEARVDVPIETGLASVIWVTAGGMEHAIPALYARRIRVNEGPDAERVPHLAACLEPANLERAPYVVELDVDLDARDPWAAGKQPRRLAIGVDEVGVTEEVLVRELSPLLRGMGPFAGAIVRGDGSLRLVLDILALAPRARALGRVPEGRVSEPPSRPPLSRRSPVPPSKPS
ncbi:Signal transduction histidine kinase CheA [Labilithrix luteola]|uniref:histidine kinase n=1 Tax=Labilithrix luteola TaxID=1391654 RepID=A0A0K1PU92_9BACT|nr:Hpt domain-containing protein [Labilithrix luteola]AKU97108.1 Signal transduction histidine kinase CheA [Labilithrix luteola]